MKAEIKDPQGLIEAREEGFYIEGSPVEFRYILSKKRRLVACLAITSTKEDELVIAVARTHKLDRNNCSKVKGRTIAAGRLEKYLATASESEHVVVWGRCNDGSWITTGGIKNEDQPFWSRFRSKFLDNVYFRLDKRS